MTIPLSHLDKSVKRITSCEMILIILILLDLLLGEAALQRTSKRLAMSRLVALAISWTEILFFCGVLLHQQGVHVLIMTRITTLVNAFLMTNRSVGQWQINLQEMFARRIRTDTVDEKRRNPGQDTSHCG